jgi:membrane protein DedA with SNARE-associated domain
VTRLIESYGLIVLFLVVAGESSGIPLPGETALVSAGVLAGRGNLSLASVLVVASVAAILGDNVGYWIGRTGGRRLLQRWGPLRRFSDRMLPPSERFFRRHGGKAVFFARFLSGFRITGAWVAGISRMPWWRFLLWNAAGGIVWAVGVGLAAYYFGHAAAAAISRYGLYGAAAILAAGAMLAVALHLWRRRMTDD